MRKVYILDDDSQHGHMLNEYLQPYGYRLRLFTDIDSFVAAATDDPPDAAIIEVYSEGSATGTEAATRLPRNANGEPGFPLIFISTQQDFDARLRAVRAGASAFMEKPVDAATLLDRLDELTEMNPPQPFRIVLVDDDPLMGRLYEMALRKAGMEVLTIPDPTRAIEAIHDHDPDLLITDLNMPQCTGLELAAVIRGHESLNTLPIVFLTADERLHTKRSAVSLGSDAFLTKPVQLADLVDTARARARRARTLRSLMIRDSLTGALNHAMIKELLESELNRARREDSALCLAMIDIDHFKRVNDTYGHAVGDRVIKSMARLLRQQLRRTDFIGRYGGEEFAVIMPRTTLEDAQQRMESLREQFGQTRHGHGDVGFNVTFSCGLAASSGETEPAALSEAADNALYAAKRSGRNRVVLHGESHR